MLQVERNRRVVDGARALGILLVVLFHTLLGVSQLVEPAVLDAFVADVPSLLNVGWQALGSELVFLVSGFLLAYLLLRDHARGRPPSLRDYLVRRGSRILPLYYLALLLYAFADDFSAFDWITNLLFVSDLVDARTIIPVGWSLELMVQVYVLLPFAVRGLLASRRPLAWLLGALAASVAARAVTLLLVPGALATQLPDFLHGAKPPAVQEALYHQLWFRASPFVLGVLVAWLGVSHGARLRRALSRGGRGDALLAGGLLLAAASGSLPLHDGESALYASPRPAFWLAFWTLQRLLFGAGCAAVLLGCLHGEGVLVRGARALLGWRPWGAVSRGIYSIYLFHLVCLVPAAALVLWTVDPDTITRVTAWHALGIFALGALLSTLLAKALTRYVELPAQAWIRARFLPARARPKRPPEAPLTGELTPGELPPSR